MLLITNIAGYQFRHINDVEPMHMRIQDICAQTHLKGSIFVSEEGINLSLAGSQKDINFIIGNLSTLCGYSDLLLNKSYSERIPFKRLVVKIRKELVPINSTTLKINQAKKSKSYINSEHLKSWLDEDKDFTLLDLRNDFEYELGSFDGAKQLHLRNFRDLINAKERIRKIPNDKPLVTFCTGGIRCEKGAPLINREGITELYQLKGGILDYLKKFGNRHWHGDCFVFDDRVSLDHQLNPSYANLCRGCQRLLTDNDETFCTSCAALT